MDPALFSLTIHSLATSLSSNLNVWYLDDGTVGGEVDQVLADFHSVMQLAPSLGLQLNTAKCKLILTGMDEVAANQTLSRFQELSPSIHPVSPKDATLLGAPLTIAAISIYLTKAKGQRFISSHSSFESSACS